MSEHVPVMQAEVIDALLIKPDGLYIDATFGRGGHSQAILKQLAPEGQLWVFDKDPAAIKVAQSLQQQDNRVKVFQGSFTQIYDICKAEGVLGNVNGLLLDLGVSSPQLDDSQRGFSFQLDGPLDMRMSEKGINAAQWLKKVDFTELSQVLKDYGEEKFANRIARAIIAYRDLSPITTTMQLSRIIRQACPRYEKGKHPATRTFQAIRIEINQEMQDLDFLLKTVPDLLATEGRLSVLIFHSLEERMLKQHLRQYQIGDLYPKRLPIQADKLKPTLKTIVKAKLPSDKEIEDNRRSRSAKLYVAKRLMQVEEELRVF